MVLQLKLNAAQTVICGGGNGMDGGGSQSDFETCFIVLSRRDPSLLLKLDITVGKVDAVLEC